jgi:CheY-like chemotaxis protein
VEQLKPDVVTCDLIMPGADGVEFIQRQMARRPGADRDRQHGGRSRVNGC